MNELPNKLFVRRSEAREFLGISEQAFTKLIENRVLTPKYFPGQKRAYFKRADVLAVDPEPKGNEPAKPATANGRQ